MKLTLKDYQSAAAEVVLAHLQKASKRWKEDGDKHAFTLTAATGAGKTVIAAAALEALFYGSDEYDFEPDSKAVVLWFSDDPALNKQTKFRLTQASDRLLNTNLVIVNELGNARQFEPGCVYFLNTQKLGKNSLLVRGNEAYGNPRPQLHDTDQQVALEPFTIWDVIRNTVEDPELTFYMVLDEAHRGMGSTSTQIRNERATIVKRLINGHDGIPGIPVVWGISATSERFRLAMSEAKDRTILPEIEVDPAEVQESGLLKDIISLEVPDETGVFDKVLLKRAVERARELSELWARYSAKQNEPDVVKPLMVIQVPNTPDHREIGESLKLVLDNWPEIGPRNIAHCFGEHVTETFGGYQVDWVSPELVQGRPHIRVLLAKDAISTGWDCPRAEVLVSFRPASDRTHITQILGRMVRAPLARRIPGDDRLNAVHALLPYFDPGTVTDVANYLMHGGGSNDSDQNIPGRRVLVNPVEVDRNAEIPAGVWELFESLMTDVRPARKANPVRRLTRFAHELAVDDLMPDAGKKIHKELHRVIDAAQTRYADQMEEAVSSILKIDGLRVTVDQLQRKSDISQFTDEADSTVIEEAFKKASRVFTKDVARTYVEANIDPDEDFEEAVQGQYLKIAALAMIDDAVVYVLEEADRIVRRLQTKHRVDLRNLPDDRRDEYVDLLRESEDVQSFHLVAPEKTLTPTFERLPDGTENPLPLYENHLLSGSDGKFPADLNDPEKAALEKEMERDTFIAWYRNPGSSSASSLGVVYDHDGIPRVLRPDFLVFHEHHGEISVSIIDPHGYHLEDALPKLKGLASLAERDSRFHRIEALTSIDGELKVLDLQDKKTRNAVIDSKGSTRTLFESAHANPF